MCRQQQQVLIEVLIAADAMANNNRSPENIPLISEERVDDHGTASESQDDTTEKESLTDEENSLATWQVMMHLFRAFAGVGILGLPSGIHHAGILAGPLTIVVIGAFSLYGMVLLSATSTEISKRTGIGSYTYGNLAKEIISVHNFAFGYFSKVFLDTILCAMQLGFCTVYFEFFGATMVKLLNHPHPRLWTISFLPVVLGLALITNIRKLVYSSIVANIALIVVLLTLFQYFIPNIKIPTPDPLITNPMAYLVAFGQFLYGFEGIGTVPTLQNKMREKDRFMRTLMITLLFVASLYISFGTTGYLAFGSNTKPSVTFNLPDEPVYQALHVVFILITLFSYPIQFFVPIDIIKSYIDHKLPNKKLIAVELGLRVSLVLFTLGLAIAIPQLDNYMALIGCSTATIVTFIFPPILHTICFWNEGLAKWQLILSTVTLLFGALSFASGTYSCILSIIKRFQNLAAA